MKYTDHYIDRFREVAHKLNFRNANLLDMLTYDEIRENINGIGSASMSPTLRKAIDKLHPSLVYPSHMHDLQWVFLCDGGEVDFYASNDDFQYNGILMSKYLHGWYNPTRYIAIHNAKVFRRILDDFGYGAYLVSPRHNIIKEN